MLETKLRRLSKLLVYREHTFWRPCGLSFPIPHKGCCCCYEVQFYGAQLQLYWLQQLMKPPLDDVAPIELAADARAAPSHEVSPTVPQEPLGTAASSLSALWMCLPQLHFATLNVCAQHSTRKQPIYRTMSFEVSVPYKHASIWMDICPNAFGSIRLMVAIWLCFELSLRAT